MENSKVCVLCGSALDGCPWASQCPEGGYNSPRLHTPLLWHFKTQGSQDWGQLLLRIKNRNKIHECWSGTEVCLEQREPQCIYPSKFLDTTKARCWPEVITPPHRRVNESWCQIMKVSSATFHLKPWARVCSCTNSVTFCPVFPVGHYEWGQKRHGCWKPRGFLCEGPKQRSTGWGLTQQKRTVSQSWGLGVPD